jgi:predicted LPLAT superfamily acyltransferase
VFVLLDRGRFFRLLTLPALRFERCGRAGPAQTVAALERVVQEMERVIARHPDQWFNFYDVWPETAS